MADPGSIVCVIDDDPSIRRAIKRLVGSVGLEVELSGQQRNFCRVLIPMFPVA